MTSQRHFRPERLAVTRLLALMTFAVLALTSMAGAAFAQDPYPPSNGGGGGGGGGPVVQPTPGPPESPGQFPLPTITITTPGATITVTGRGWGPPGAVVTVERTRGGTTTGQVATASTVSASGYFKASFTATEEDRAEGAVFAVSGRDTGGAEHIVEALAGSSAVSPGFAGMVAASGDGVPDAAAPPVAAPAADREDPAADAPGALAAAGGPFTVGSALALALLVTGGAAVYVARRRRDQLA
jgi:hypothetical protein